MPDRIGLISAAFLIIACAGSATAQDTSPASAPPANPVLQKRPAPAAMVATPDSTAAPRESVSLTVPVGTPVQVVLDQEVRIKRVGQPIQGHVVEPIFAFDKLEIPVGTQVNGQITKIENVSAGRRTLAALDADFTPTRKIQVEFNEFVLADGKHIPVSTAVSLGSGLVIQLITAPDNDQKKTLKDVASEKTKEAKQEARRQWDAAMQQVNRPGKIHRIERYGIDQLPIRPQYIDAGTAYFAELQKPLDFGSEPLTPELASSLNAPPPDGSFVHARLVTPLNSATTQKGDEVDAVLSQPLFDQGKLILPQGSRLKGSVVQVQPARLLSHNGQLRFVFHDLVLPDGVEQKVDAILQGVQADKAGNVKLDSEGGAEATAPKSRYLKTAVSVGLAMLSAGGDGDAKGGNPAGNTNNRIAGGAGGFKVVGILLGAFVHSRALGYSMGAYGAGMTIYAHFIARGHDIVFPKNTALEVAIGTRQPTPQSTPASPKGQ